MRDRFCIAIRPGPVAGLCLLIAGVTLLSACSTSSEITATWQNPEASVTNFDKVLVLGMSENLQARTAVETAMANRLQARGVNVVRAVDAFSPQVIKDAAEDKQRALALLRENDIDGLLIVRLLDSKEEEYWVPGSTYYQPMPYYGGWYPYWSTSYRTVYDPGYMARSTQIFLESNLYDVASEELLWSAQSRTDDPSDAADLAESFSEKVVAALAGSGVVNL
jgi:hypothetical protein